ncbi:hypothetical protein [Mycetocola reblochoni]|uniref:Uncharacterized protein n=2 Tax=Mycetocola reblochoni TaxID=331618 RepID=A0A1R4JD79_9MICO|nr:hypothetical protein [Mycetocola reblochoni]RLP69948.1 hypothetical protein D9V30_04515 [Mycetocola reblochoni]SJN29939.1 hypothetical protein FM119_06875 [Mycetocola reblochoni REB411]
MPDALLLTDSHAVSDLSVFLGRALRLTPDAVRLAATEGVLTVTVPVLVPKGILDRSPTVLGMRAMREHSGARSDRVVDVRAVTERIARPAQLTEDGHVLLRLPDAEQHVSWAGTVVPRGDWRLLDELPAAVVARVATDGIAAVATALPQSPGEAVVDRVRAEVWAPADDRLGGAPAAAALAADSLGFIPDEAETLRLFGSGRWLRLSSRAGHVLVRHAPGA